MSQHAKLQRWIDLIAALLGRSLPATFAELARDVPEYWAKLRAGEEERDAARRDTIEQSLKRTFERDKDELRKLGVAIESVPDEAGNEAGAYRLRRRDFYLPYLSLVVPEGRRTEPNRIDRYGYQALASLCFEPDELQAVVDAAACVRSLGDPVLAHEAASALRKLAVDLPVDVGASATVPTVVLPRTRHDAAVFDALSDALVRRKRVTFAYHAMSTDREETREVEPFGLFFLHGHWYLVARDRDRDALRNFRLNRIRAPKVNAARAQSPDYEIPADFRLREHARSRHAWELGDGEPVHAVVEFAGGSGAVMAAARLGKATDDHPRRRVFHVRRADAFARWLLSFAGEATPVAPTAIVERFQAEARSTAAVYGREPTPATTSGRAEPAAAERRAPRAERWLPKGASEQFRRILHLVPQIADGEEHALADVAARVGIDVDTLRRDLYSLSARYDTPPGFVDGVQLLLEADRVSAHSNHLLRPMRLTVPELCALELGLAVLRGQRTPDEHAALDRARERLGEVIARLPDDEIPDGLYGASLGEHGSTLHLAAVRCAIGERRKLRLLYRKSGAEEPTRRVVSPHALVAANGMLYIVASSEGDDGLRIFRMDRLEQAVPLDTRVEEVADEELDALLRSGRVFQHPHPEVMRVRYSPRIARWIAEREGVPLAEDGSLTLEHPVADESWAMRHVLQYGPDAEILEPSELRERIRSRLSSIWD